MHRAVGVQLQAVTQHEFVAPAPMRGDGEPHVQQGDQARFSLLSMPGRPREGRRRRGEGCARQGWRVGFGATAGAGSQAGAGDQDRAGAGTVGCVVLSGLCDSRSLHHDSHPLRSQSQMIIVVSGMSPYKAMVIPSAMDPTSSRSRMMITGRLVAARASPVRRRHSVPVRVAASKRRARPGSSTRSYRSVSDSIRRSLSLIIFPLRVARTCLVVVCYPVLPGQPGLRSTRHRSVRLSVVRRRTALTGCASSCLRKPSCGAAHSLVRSAAGTGRS
jgi:hypothetical protein